MWVYLAVVAILFGTTSEYLLVDRREEIRFTLDLMNTVRGEISPLAANMQVLTWNEDLASAARNFSSKCRVGTNPNRAQEVGMDEVGEIWAITTTTGENYERAVEEAWIQESFDYSYDSNECLNENGCRNFTQMAWATATEVGCSSTNCSSLEPAYLNAPAQYYVCYYNRQADYSQQPYIAGRPCSVCLKKQYCYVERFCKTNPGDDGDDTDNSFAKTLTASSYLVIFNYIILLW